jgi:hypothetical protein
LSRAFSSHNKSGGSAGSWISSAGEITTLKSNPARASNSRRRGDPEASTRGMAAGKKIQTPNEREFRPGDGQR